MLKSTLQKILFEEVFSIVEMISKESYYPKQLPLQLASFYESESNILRAVHHYLQLGVDEDQIIIVKASFDKQHIDAMLVRTKKEYDLKDIFSDSIIDEYENEDKINELFNKMPELSLSQATKIYVVVAKKLEPEQQRYSICKEFCHILFDKKQHITKDIIELCNNLISEDTALKLLEDEAIKSEMLTHYLARELLMPYKQSIEYLKSSMSSYEISKIFNIPEKQVDFLRTPWYMELREKFFEN